MAEEVDETKTLPSEIEVEMHKWMQLSILDLFHGPETIKTREFVKRMKREPLSTPEELKAELEDYYKKCEEIING